MRPPPSITSVLSGLLFSIFIATPLLSLEAICLAFNAALSVLGDTSNPMSAGFIQTATSSGNGKLVLSAIQLLGTMGIIVCVLQLWRIFRLRSYYYAGDGGSHTLDTAPATSIPATDDRPSVPSIIEAAFADYDKVRDDVADKQSSIDFQLDYPDLFRVQFAPAAAFYEQFNATKTLASRCADETDDRRLAEQFAESAKTSRTLWADAVAAAITALDDGTSSLDVEEQAKLRKARGLVKLACDKATPDDTRESYWAAVAKLLATINLNLMQPDARLAIRSAIDNPKALAARLHPVELTAA